MVDVHLHLLAGAQKVNRCSDLAERTKADRRFIWGGPSAGIAMVCVLVSLCMGVCVPVDITMTGEVVQLLQHLRASTKLIYFQIALRGHIEPAGGIKEKVLGAHRTVMKKVILPWADRKDVNHDIPQEIQNSIQFFSVKTVLEGLEAAFGKENDPWHRPRGALAGVRLCSGV